MAGQLAAHGGCPVCANAEAKVFPVATFTDQGREKYRRIGARGWQRGYISARFTSKFHGHGEAGGPGHGRTPFVLGE